MEEPCKILKSDQILKAEPKCGMLSVLGLLHDARH